MKFWAQTPFRARNLCRLIDVITIEIKCHYTFGCQILGAPAGGSQLDYSIYLNSRVGIVGLDNKGQGAQLRHNMVRYPMRLRLAGAEP